MNTGTSSAESISQEHRWLAPKWLAILIAMVAVLVLTNAQSVSAQDEDCPSIVTAALATTQDACLDTGRNQACYGNVTLAMEPWPDMDEVVFEQQGDMVDLGTVRTLTLGAMDVEANEWGVALLRLQANLPDTLPGQNVTFLMFGDVEIENAVETPRLDAGGDADALAPMQAFYFRSGMGDAGCAESPNSGIMIQTPEGQGEIQLTVNGVEVVLGSTAFIQTRLEDDSGEMRINLLEGVATVTAFDETRFVTAGTRVRVPVDGDLEATGPPSEVEPYDVADVAALPGGNLAEEIVLSSPLDTGEVVAAGDDMLPLSGEWLQTGVSAENCDLPEGSTFVEQAVLYDFAAENDGAVLVLTATMPESDREPLVNRFDRVEPGMYRSSIEGFQTTVRFSFTEMTIENVSENGCTLTARSIYAGPGALPPSGNWTETIVWPDTEGCPNAGTVIDNAAQVIVYDFVVEDEGAVLVWTRSTQLFPSAPPDTNTFQFNLIGPGVYERVADTGTSMLEITPTGFVIEFVGPDGCTFTQTSTYVGPAEE